MMKTLDDLNRVAMRFARFVGSSHVQALHYLELAAISGELGEIVDDLLASQSQTYASITRYVNDNPDSIEIGAPSRGGAIKVYGNVDDPEAFKLKVKEAFKIRAYAQELEERGIASDGSLGKRLEESLKAKGKDAG